ncbi:GIY-YIG nuclease family protein [Streptomyces sp. NPDC101151]|uniref:GIY-YIG nuclease family protein n=1 Tax=Streptomyces sp. NPDC101151 TaxID=3366115 RepID=UPI0037F7279B
MNVPDTQGVYIIKMNDGKVYVGSATKTKTIHRRVHRAFSDDKHAAKGSTYTSSDVRELDWIEVPGGDEALIYQHEQSLIDYYEGIGGGTLLNRINAQAP